MKKILLLLLSAGCTIPGNAQSVKDTAKQQRHTIFRNFSIGLPVLYSGYGLSAQSNKTGNLPGGMNFYLKEVRSTSEALLPVTPNYSFRVLALYFKDKIGLELSYAGYGAYTRRDAYNGYLADRYAGYYMNEHNGKEGVYSFNGWRYGLMYKFHYRGLIIEPKLMVGFEKGPASGHTDQWYFKEMGSNQFTDLEIKTTYPERKSSYHAQLNIAKQYGLKYGKVRGETGLYTAYLYAPYRFSISIKEAPYGHPETVTKVDFEDVFRQFRFGLYTIFYLRNR